MDQLGYKKDRFPKLLGQMFDCVICGGVVKSPKQCSGCGNMFCSYCITDYLNKNKACPSKCVGSQINTLSSRALLNIYKQLDVKCIKCPKILKLSDLQKHEQLCGKPKCEFHDSCNGFQNKKEQFAPFCSDKCKLLSTIIQCKADPKTTHELLSKYAPKVVVVQKPSEIRSAEGSIKLTWSKKQCGMNITVSADSSSVFLKQQAYVFRTVLTSQPFTSGRHYWEIHADGRTENQLKIGVSASNNFQFDTAFCDHKFGYAYYGLGQLRHASNATGPQYGKRFKKTGVLGVYLNMDAGTLYFSLNGQDFGQAYQDNELKKGPLYPAVALLHCSGCTIKGQLPIPSMYQAR